MPRIQEFAKIDSEEWVLLSEGFDGSWSYLIWGRPPVQGYLGRTPEIDAKKKAPAPRLENSGSMGLNVSLFQSVMVCETLA